MIPLANPSPRSLRKQSSDGLEELMLCPARPQAMKQAKLDPQ